MRFQRNDLLLAGLAALSLIGYLLASHLTFRLGFPLDDAWIHQTYARNWVRYGEWAFLPGQPSAGSTAPLWSFMLVPGFILNLAPYVWTYLMGWMLLWAVAMVGWRIFQRMCLCRLEVALWAGIFLCLEWHLAWAAASGMEILLFALVVLLVFYFLLDKSFKAWFPLGMLVGLSLFIRPDGVTLVAPASLAILLSEPGANRKLLGLGKFLLGLLLPVLGYLSLNSSLSGRILPNTFFAKQTEYALFRQLPLVKRLADQALLPLVGAGVLLLPSFMASLYRGWLRRSWGVLLSVVWLVGFICLYAWRLPVTYQHGRYIMPAMPVYFLLGLGGLATWVQLSSSITWKRVLSQVWLLSLSLVLVFFWARGARAYAEDVAVIESEMVTTAQWIGENTAEQALIAAHDIGALGFFSERKLLDLAGLVSPEVVPFMRDEAQLASYLNARRADYLVTLRGDYPYLEALASLIYSTDARFSPALGGTNMAVYRWSSP